MKKIFLALAVTLLFTFTLTSCANDGRTTESGSGVHDASQVGGAEAGAAASGLGGIGNPGR